MTVNPISFLKENPIDEGLVLQLFVQPTNQLLLVIDDPFLVYLPERDHPKEKIRKFLRLQFLGLANYKRKKGFKRLYNCSDYDRSRDRCLVDIYGVYVNQIGEGYTFSATFANYGFVSFTFSALEVSSLVATAIQKSNKPEWIYIDQVTGGVVDFYDPFKIMPSVKIELAPPTKARRMP